MDRVRFTVPGAPRRRRKHPEDALQVAVAGYLQRALPPDATWWATPNGGTRVQKTRIGRDGKPVKYSPEAARLKAMGARAGIPDLWVLHHGHLIGIELKAARGALSPAQIETMDVLRRAGAWCYSARSVDDVDTILRLANVPLRIAQPLAGAAPCCVVQWWPRTQPIPDGWRPAPMPPKARAVSHDYWSVMIEMGAE